MGKRSVMVAVLAIAMLLLASSVCLAANQAKLTVQVDLSEKYFWTYPYITSDGKIRKPAAVNVEWTIDTSSRVQRQTIILPDKIDGQIAIMTERGAIVNLQINVVDAGNTVLGNGSLQICNKGQQEKFYVSLPNSTSPVVTRDEGNFREPGR